LAAALGYFVDAYDLILYNIVRMKSLQGLGVADADLMRVGLDLLNAQLIGMLLGGVFWGVWGDKKGRRSVLFGSIFLYSAATLANGFIHTLTAYTACRFLAGIGLAGELGAGVTLVSEIMPPKTRGYGTMLVASVGVLGVVTASVVGDLFPWRTAYFVGGTLGLGLLLLRMGVTESGLFESLKTRPVEKGNFLMLFNNGARFRKYLCVVLSALPIWFLIGLFVTFSPEIGKSLGLDPSPQAGRSVLFFYIGITLGDLTTGYLSQRYRSRKKVMGWFLGLAGLATAGVFVWGGQSLSLFYAGCGLLGWTSGYWAVFITASAEQFGTNLRATAATTAPNFVRGLTVPLALVFKPLAASLGAVHALWILGVPVWVMGFIALSRLEETYGKDLDYFEK